MTGAVSAVYTIQTSHSLPLCSVLLKAIYDSFNRVKQTFCDPLNFMKKIGWEQYPTEGWVMTHSRYYTHRITQCSNWRVNQVFSNNNVIISDSDDITADDNTGDNSVYSYTCFHYFYFFLVNNESTVFIIILRKWGCWVAEWLVPCIRAQKQN